MTASPLTDNAPLERERVQIKHAAHMELKPLPIELSWIIEGNPIASAANHSNNFDGWAGSGVWDCTAGRFHWHFGWEETLMILEGEVHVTDDHGVTSILREGDIGYFPAGSHFVWFVPQYVKKLVFFRREVPPVVQGVYKVRSIVGQALRKFIPALR